MVYVLEDGKIVASLEVPDDIPREPIFRLANMNGRLRGTGSSVVIIQGDWGASADASQTDYDPDFLGFDVGGYVGQATPAINDEIRWPDLPLNAGTYVVTVAYVKTLFGGILNVLHGVTSLGTIDMFAGATAYNQVATLTYSPTAYAKADFRLGTSSKNVGSSGYGIFISRLEIRKTA